MNRTEGRKTISQTVCTDEATMELWDRLSRRLGTSHSEVARLAIRNLAGQWAITSATIRPDGTAGGE